MRSRSKLVLWIGVGVAIAVVLGGLAWERWEPVLRYRQHRLEARMDLVTAKYLAGERSFEVAAEELARLIKSEMDVAARLPVPAGEQGSLVAIGKMPGSRDPRVDSLQERAFILAASPALRPRMEELLRQARAQRRPPN